ncbi:MAG: cytochrome c3 family protein [Nitrospinota bacterium]
MIFNNIRIFVVINIFLILFVSYAIASDDWEIGGPDPIFDTSEEKTEGCKECHKEVYDSLEKYTYRHSDFIDKRCNYCHIAIFRKRGSTGDDRSKNEDGHGKGLKSREEAGIDSCMEFECHPTNRLGVSHPVRIYPKGKTRIPSDLPTGERGMLTCTTCHEPHGSNTRYFIRKKILRDLCVACHQEDNL